MPHLVWSAAALADVARLCAFLAPNNPDAACRAVVAIRHELKTLRTHPEIGRPVENMLPEFREWMTEFGHSACVALYHFDGRRTVVLTVRHGREAGY
ncbi:MAG TPA: type II toxin-antitoxin system RelE/ParE family toxin [Acidobacteriaceae bacterium]|nr:type II toxin-antitoxin system RelE/ParE family toxin [Acidobacteriaceae bacterium]